MRVASSPTKSPWNPEKRTWREQAITNQVQRLDKQIIRLEQEHNRISWWRLGIFSLGVMATYLGRVYGGVWLGAVCFFISTASFVAVVLWHRKLGDWIDRLKIWRVLRQGQIARMKLDWEGIPALSLPPDSLSHNSLALDLDLVGKHSLHQLIDRCISIESSQRLASWLTQPESNLVIIHQRQTMVGELKEMSRFRDRLFLNLKLVSNEPIRGANMLEWLRIKFPDSRLNILLVLSSLFCLVNIALFFLNLAGVLPPIWPVTYLLYLAFYFSTSGMLKPFLDAIVQLDSELEKFRSLLNFLETYPYDHHYEVAKLCDIFWNSRLLPSRQLRRIRGVTAAIGARMNPIAGLVLNMFTPWDYTAAFIASRLRQNARETLPAWLETWTQLETLCSLADFAYLNPDYTFPSISTDCAPVFKAGSLGHPLIPFRSKVCNDFTINDKGEVILVTGSNMAGKSTFIKTIGSNLSLAYAGAPVNSLTFKSRLFRLHTCIRISDSISDGFSYFYAEVKCLKRLLEEMQETNKHPLLYLIDEIFRGTNNRERYQGSLAYIESLVGAAGTGLIATHDLELARLSENHPGVFNYHFSDSVEEGRLSFDYTIRPGPSQTTNALKIMEMEGLPVKASLE